MATADKIEEKYLYLDKEIVRRKGSLAILNSSRMFCYPV
jgi:hypothetical protein